MGVRDPQHAAQWAERRHRLHSRRAEVAEVDSFNRFIQHIVNQGYMVIAPNYRGSTGYGKAFEDANLFDMGGGDLQDVLAAADFI